jgi:hypothetical protein
MPTEVALNNVQDGAVLAADVLDARENVLLTSGTRLTSAHISLIKRRGIRSVIVRTPEDPAPAETGSEEDTAARVAELLERQKRVFVRALEAPRMDSIYRAARAHIRSGNLPPV